MAEIRSPTYVFDYRDKNNCLRVEDAKQNEEIDILVCPAEHNQLGAPIPAKGMRTEDGLFHIKVITHAGEQSHNWNYTFLMNQIKIHRGD